MRRHFRTRSTGRAGAKAPLLLWATSAVCSALLGILLASRSSFYFQQPASSPCTSSGSGEEAEAEVGRHHHRRRACDDQARWVAKMASLHNASLVLTVDRTGCANFTSLQKAVDAVPDYAAARTLIAIDAGVYAEKVVVWSNKTGVTLQGRGNLNTTIVWNDTARRLLGIVPHCLVRV
jgi:pectin methylesterase-like acyl-CoA thioesterase